MVLVPRNAERVEAEADAGARRSLRLARRLYGAPFTVPLSLATRVVGTDDIEAALRTLAEGRTEVTGGWPEDPEADEHVEVQPEACRRAVGPRRGARGGPRAEHACGAALDPPRPGARPRHRRGRGPAAVASRRGRPGDDRGRAGAARRELHAQPAATPGDGSPQRGHAATWSPGPTRSSRTIDEDGTRRALPEELELRRPGGVDLEDWVAPVAIPGDALETVVIDDLAIEPAVEPVIGPEFAAARTRLGLSVDQVAERTRIRPHVIESIEVDDFVPCGGDFYARGHIRTLARILGVDAAPLLASYDERYADAPVNPRRVFEAELAHSGGIRATRGGPNWSVLVAAVMALVLAWSIARLVMDGPVGPQRRDRPQRLRRPEPPGRPRRPGRARRGLGPRLRRPGDRP